MNLVPESEFRLGPDLLVQQRSHNGKSCGFQNDTLKAGDNGYLTSLNYPSDYPPSTQCIWWLKVGFTGSDNEFRISIFDFQRNVLTDHSFVCLIVLFCPNDLIGSKIDENW